MKIIVEIPCLPFSIRSLNKIIWKVIDISQDKSKGHRQNRVFIWLDIAHFHKHFQNVERAIFSNICLFIRVNSCNFPKQKYFSNLRSAIYQVIFSLIRCASAKHRAIYHRLKTIHSKNILRSRKTSFINEYWH